MEAQQANATGESGRRLYRSRYGGLWIDGADAEEILARKLRDGEVEAADADPLLHYIRHGYVVFPQAVSHALVDEYLDCFEDAWKQPPAGIYAHSSGEVVALSD